MWPFCKPIAEPLAPKVTAMIEKVHGIDESVATLEKRLAELQAMVEQRSLALLGEIAKAKDTATTSLSAVASYRTTAEERYAAVLQELTRLAQQVSNQHDSLNTLGEAVERQRQITPRIAHEHVCLVWDERMAQLPVKAGGGGIAGIV